MDTHLPTLIAAAAFRISIQGQFFLSWYTLSHTAATKIETCGDMQCCQIRNLTTRSRPGLVNLWMWKDFLGTQHSLLSQFFFIYFAWPASLYCEEYVYIHIYDCAEIVHELPLLPNNAASETFLRKLGVVRSVGWICITGAAAGRWLGEYVTLDKMFYSILFKQK